MLLLMVGGWGFTRGGPAQACCRKCRYPVEGLRTEICPECGCDLRADGTLQPGMSYIVHPSRPVAIICRTLIVLLPAVALLNAEVQSRQRIVTTAEARAGSSSDLFGLLRITGRAVNTLPRIRTVARLEGPAATVTLHVQDLAVRVRYHTPDGTWRATKDAMTDDDVLTWMAAAGIDTSTHSAQVEASAIASLIRHVVAGGRAFTDRDKGPAMQGLTNVSLTVAHVATPRWWVLIIILLAATAMWLAFMADIIPWRRLWLRPVSSSPSATTMPRIQDTL